MIALLLHLEVSTLQGPRQADLCTATASLLTRLHQQGVPAAVLLQCSSAPDAAACLALIQPAADVASAPVTIAQPGQLPVALRLTLDQLAPIAAPSIACISVADSGSAASQAAALGCTSQHLPARSVTPAQLHAWALQAVVGLAAAQADVAPLVVGYVMKESRQLALSQQGMLPLLPVVPQREQHSAASSAAPATAGVAAAANAHTAHAAAAGTAAGGTAAGPPMCFVPLDLGSSLPPQLARCHLVLQKLTDCLQPSPGSGAVAQLTLEAQALLALLDQQQQQQQEEEEEVQMAAGAAPRQQLLPQQQPAQQLPPQQLPLCLVDSLASLHPIMDRAALIPHLQAVAIAVRQRGIAIRAPASLLLHAFDSSTTPRQLAAAGLSMPCIVKPQAACGVAEAHQMAFVLHWSGFADLEVPLPALAQEYVDHGGTVWKVYVAGEQVFWTQRKSTPDLGPLAQRLADNPEADIPSSIGFDSLKSLPTTLPWLRTAVEGQGQGLQGQQGQQGQGQQGQQQQSQPGQEAGRGGPQSGGEQAAAGGHEVAQQAAQQVAAQGVQQEQEARRSGMAARQAGAAPSGLDFGQEVMRAPTFEAVASVLRQRLGLTLFGFDLVFDPAAGELVIIDVNYFPSFKGVPEAPAALQAALQQRYAQHLAAAAVVQRA